MDSLDFPCAYNSSDDFNSDQSNNIKPTTSNKKRSISSLNRPTITQSKLKKSFIKTDEDYNHICILFLRAINDYLIQKKYKPILKQIKLFEKKNRKHIPINYEFIITEIRIICSFKYLTAKIEKFQNKVTYISLNKNNSNVSISKLETLFDVKFKALKKQIQKLINFITINDLTEENYKERTIKYYCKLLYYQALVMKIKKQSQDSFSILNIAQNWLKLFIDKCKEAETVQIYEDVWLWICSWLIDDCSYQIAIEHLKLCWRLCVKELYWRFDIENGVYWSNLDTNDNKNFGKTMQNIISCLYLLGICFENWNEIVRAIEAYKQTRWFTMKFYYKYNQKFCEIAQETEKMAFRFYDIYTKTIQEKEAIQLKIKAEVERKRRNLEKHKRWHFIACGWSQSVQSEKYDNWQKQITSWENQFWEPNTININQSKSKRINTLINTMNIYNDLLSQDYHPFVNENKRLNYEIWNKDNFSKIDQFRNTILSKRNYSLERKMKIEKNKKGKMWNTNESAGEIGKGKWSQKNTCYTSTSRLISNQSLSFRNNCGEKNNNNIIQSSSVCNNNAYRLITLNSERVSLTQNKTNTKSRVSTTHEKVKSYPIKNNFLFKKSFHSKMKSWEIMSNKEITFQKQWLASKKNEKILIKNINQEELDKKAINKIQRIKLEVDEKIRLTNFIYKPVKTENKLDQLNKKISLIEESAISGLSTKKIVRLTELMKLQEDIKKEQKNKYIPSSTALNNLERIKQDHKSADIYNNYMWAKLSKDIDITDKQKELIKVRYKK